MPRYGNPTTYTDMDPPSYSDGVDTVYPSNTDQQASPENWYSLRDIDDEKAVMFRVRGAASILAKFPQPTMPQGVEYILTGFPANYKLFKHTKKQSVGGSSF